MVTIIAFFNNTSTTSSGTKKWAFCVQSPMKIDGWKMNFSEGHSWKFSRGGYTLWVAPPRTLFPPPDVPLLTVLTPEETAEPFLKGWNSDRLPYRVTVETKKSILKVDKGVADVHHIFYYRVTSLFTTQNWKWMLRKSNFESSPMFGVKLQSTSMKTSTEFTVYVYDEHLWASASFKNQVKNRGYF